MRLTLPILLFMSVLSTTAAARHHRGTLMNSPRRDTNIRRRAKEGDDETEQMMKNLKVKVSKSTGEITVSRAKMSKTKDKASAVKILINKIVEVDEDGNPVGTNEEGVKHSISPSEDMKLDVEVQAYTAPIPIEEEDEVDVDADVDADTEVADENEGNEIIDTTTPGTDSIDLGTTEDTTNPTAETDTVDDRRRYLQDDTNPAATGLNVTMFGSLQGDSNIRVEMWLISGGGVVGTQTERWVVQPSDMKFNILMENWNFCDPCEDSTVGKYLDVHIQIKGGKSPKRAKGSATIVGRKNGVVGNAEENEGDEDKGKAWDIGDGTMLDFSSVVTINGVETTMPDKYPEFVSDGNTQYYILRFPKFDDLRYDPVVTFDEDYDSAATFQLVSYTTTYGAMLLAYVLLL
eukprot:CAMPEP_0198249836 /NCGR_PEP_ID=MMETSP1447-20131203/1221_1 /TAXON_ID=420782 /ORGANISM="Chaetoceros dichaeta, Strain CCMP1751" /LENGTH=403 /DNA_ID=CAMNT_0043934553 /DNA_START=45 /DNA_END=1256 /DNA_ORIENTATION=-